MGHFIFCYNRSLIPYFETKNRFETEVKPKYKVMFKFWFETKFQNRLITETKVLTNAIAIFAVLSCIWVLILCFRSSA